MTPAPALGGRCCLLPPRGPPWTPAGSSLRAALLGTQASQVGARGVLGEESGRSPGLRDTKAVSSKGRSGDVTRGFRYLWVWETGN